MFVPCHIPCPLLHCGTWCMLTTSFPSKISSSTFLLFKLIPRRRPPVLWMFPELWPCPSSQEQPQPGLFCQGKSQNSDNSRCGLKLILNTDKVKSCPVFRRIELVHSYLLNPTRMEILTYLRTGPWQDRTGPRTGQDHVLCIICVSQSLLIGP